VNTIDRDQYGHCIMCHQNLRYKKVVDGQETDLMKPEYDETDFLLNNNSKMRVVVCKPCKNVLKPADEAGIMDKVVKGWEWELKVLQDEKRWAKEKCDTYLKSYRRLRIVCRSENVPKDRLDKKFKEYKEKKEKKSGSGQ
jgi:hypothetical protein